MAMATPEESRETIRAWLDARREPVEDLARGAGLGGSTIRAWLAGRRSPRPRSLRLLADEIDRRARRDLQAADDLRRIAAEIEDVP